MEKILTDGIPSVQRYRQILESDLFKEMEGFSNGFVMENQAVLQRFMKKWVKDPLHQWSRQWEYPYVFSKVKQMAESIPAPSILDAGSGVGFFTYYVNTQIGSANIHTCDYDPLLLKIYEELNARKEMSIEFSPNNLKDLSYQDNSFDMVYCISVLEHTDNYQAIIEEFYRVLRPGGMLVVTFDVSLDGLRDISVDRAAMLLSLLSSKFDNDKDHLLNLLSQSSASEVFTTSTANDIDPASMPWQGPSFLHRVKSFINTGRFGAWPPPLTVFCVGLTKPAS